MQVSEAHREPVCGHRACRRGMTVLLGSHQPAQGGFYQSLDRVHRSVVHDGSIPLNLNLCYISLSYRVEHFPVPSLYYYFCGLTNHMGRVLGTT